MNNTPTHREHNRSIFDSFFDDTFFEPMFTVRPLQTMQRLHAFPKIDVEEHDHEYVVKANIPGIEPKDVRIEATDDGLYISGTYSREERKEEKGKLSHYERESGSFARHIPLGVALNSDGIRAQAKHGVYTITVPKAQHSKKKKIEIETE